MPRRATAVIELQDALFGDPPPDPTPAVPQPAAGARVTKLNRTGHTRPPRRDKEWNEITPCAPTCIACRRPEPAEDADSWPLCPATRGRCATLCEHTLDAFKADVCVITLHVVACLMTLPYSGRTVAAVTCPYCGLLHAHDSKPGRHYRVSRCRTGRKPYIVHVPERSTP